MDSKQTDETVNSNQSFEEQSSESNEIIQTDEESTTQTLEPIDPTRFSCVVSYDNENVTLYDRCFFSNTKEGVSIYLIRSLFNDFYNESDGGSIYIQNCALLFYNANFTNCVSLNGCGGAIFIENLNNAKNDIVLENLTFTKCKATCGGAVYLISKSEISNISINFCVFTSNEINEKRINRNNEFFWMKCNLLNRSK